MESFGTSSYSAAVTSARWVMRKIIWLIPCFSTATTSCFLSLTQNDVDKGFCVTVLVRRLKVWMIYTASRLCLNTTSASICFLLSVRLLKGSSITVSIPWLKGCYASFTTTWWPSCFPRRQKVFLSFFSVQRLDGITVFLVLVQWLQLDGIPASLFQCNDNNLSASLFPCFSKTTTSWG